MDAGQLGVVDDVGPESARLGGLGDGTVDRDLVRGGDDQPGAVEPVRGRIRRQGGQFVPLAAQSGQLRLQNRGADLHLRRGRQQRLDLASGHRAATDHQHGAACEIREQGEQGGHDSENREEGGLRNLALQPRWRK